MRQGIAGYGARVAVGIVMAIAVLLAGCSETPDGRQRGPDEGRAWPPWEAPGSGPAPSPRSGGGVAECFDGECEIEVSRTTEVPLDPRFRIATLKIRIVGQELVTFEAKYTSGGHSQITIGGTGMATLDDITVRINGFEDGKALLELSPT